MSDWSNKVTYKPIKRKSANLVDVIMKSIPPYLVLIICTLLLSSPVFSQTKNSEIADLWQSVTTESASLLEKTRELTSKLAGDTSALAQKINDALAAELNTWKELATEPSRVDVQEKIDTIRMHVENISELKKEEVNAPAFTLFSKSKKYYRTEINDILEDIEPVLFDGEIVDYATRIRNHRKQINHYQEKKVSLNEDLFFAPAEGTLLKSSKEEIEKEIAVIDSLTSKSLKLIDELEFDLKKKMHALGIDLTREQVRLMTARVDGDELARSFAIFDVTKQISNTLGELVKENSFSAETTLRYYGTYVILSEILGYSQGEYINKIKNLYLPAISQIEDDIEDSIKFAKNSFEQAKSKSNREILQSNIASNEKSLKVVGRYRDTLMEQIEKLEAALQRTNEHITVVYSTYDTAANSANLVNLISETQDTFTHIMDMQIPEIIPFENTKLDEFQEISDRIVNATKT